MMNSSRKGRTMITLHEKLKERLHGGKDPYLCGIVDPLQGLVARDHRREIGERAHGVVGAPGRVFALFQDHFSHDDRVKVVDDTLEEHQSQREGETFGVVSLSITSSGSNRTRKYKNSGIHRNQRGELTCAPEEFRRRNSRRKSPRRRTRICQCLQIRRLGRGNYLRRRRRPSSRSGRSRMGGKKEGEEGRTSRGQGQVLREQEKLHRRSLNQTRLIC